MAESGQERTERATPKRLKEAREKGQVPRSQELSIAAVCIAAAVAIYGFMIVVARQRRAIQKQLDLIPDDD